MLHMINSATDDMKDVESQSRASHRSDDREGLTLCIPERGASKWSQSLVIDPEPVYDLPPLEWALPPVYQH
jgi:hypothetical protein